MGFSGVLRVSEHVIFVLQFEDGEVQPSARASCTVPLWRTACNDEFDENRMLSSPVPAIAHGIAQSSRAPCILHRYIPV